MRYHMVTAYDDFAAKDEHTDDIISALETAAIYLRDNTCWRVSIWDTVTETWVLDYCRP